MSDNRRMTTDRFYGGVSNRLANLRAMLTYIRAEQPTREDVTQWVMDNTRAGSADAVSHHLTFLATINLIALSDAAVELGAYGERWLSDDDPEILYEALATGVKGFDVLVEALADGGLTDDEIMELLVREFEEAKMSKPGPAVRHREWLQALGYAERSDGVTGLTAAGYDLLERRELIDPGEEVTSVLQPTGLAVGDALSKDEIEAVFETGFGYQISRINPRRDNQGRRYVLVFANEDGPYDDAVRYGRFEYIGEGQSGDQSPSSPGNSTLIDGVDEEFPIHFFYQEGNDGVWEYQGLVDVVEWTVESRDGRDVIVFMLEHKSTADTGGDEPSSAEVAAERTELEQAVAGEPQLTSDEMEFTESRRRARDRAFAGLVRDVYDASCAVCGDGRESPTGSTEVEAAHIYPKQHGGADDVRNGLALCQLHHWAFDVGWLGITNEYEILVADAPDKEGYYEFKQLEGKTLELPEDPELQPDPMYLKSHRDTVFEA